MAKIHGIDCVRESGFDCVSPVGASMYCSPHPVALHIGPAARLREFAFRISRTRGFSRQFIYLELKARFLKMSLTNNPRDFRLQMESTATCLSYKMVRKLQGCWSNLQVTSSP